jgi:hypothetical protein
MIIAMGVNTADISLLNMLFTMRDQEHKILCMVERFNVILDALLKSCL